MTTNNHHLLLAFYGDDFTGSTDALEFLSRAGAKTVLFIQPPTPQQLQRYQGLDAIGIAGMTRAMVPGEMEKELKIAFSALQLLNVPHVHYKVCSTFDSSPAVGSIGKAIDTGAAIFKAPFVPLLVGAPLLGRYCVFGNLFARMGIGSQGKIYRLDRHPSMSRHPVTPSDESDLRLHLSKQTSKKIGLIDILQITLPLDEAKTMVDNTIRNGAEIVLFDILYEEQMEGIGRLIDSYAATNKTLFSTGSSGIEMALGSYWQKEGLLKVPDKWEDAGAADALLVVSGSCSPVTSAQIEWALQNGFAEIAIDTAAIAVTNDLSSVIADNISAAAALINKGQSVIIHTSRGASDERVERTNEVLQQQGFDLSEVRTKTADIYGTALGRIAKAVAEQTTVKRIVIAGGDTSSFAARAMGIEAVEMLAPLSPGAPLCKAYAPGSAIDGLEVNFKGGQVGKEDYFGMVRQGKFV